MAQRRMFNVKLCDSARFLKMPLSTQALYFHLGLRADDDGIVEAFTVLRVSGASEDDLKLLIAKGYITLLNDEYVSYINDWTTNNLIRSDRKVESIYKDLLIKVKSIDVQCLQPSDDQMTDIVQPSDNQMTAQVSIGKVSVVKESKEKENNKASSRRFTPPTLEEVISYCQKRNNSIDPEQFIDHYTSNGWMRGNTKIKDWQACVRTWEKRSKPATTSRYEFDDTGCMPIDGISYSRHKRSIVDEVE